MAAEKVKIGIVGLGNIAQTAHLPALAKMQGVEIVAVCDQERARAQLVAEKYGVKRWYNDFNEMLAKEDEMVAVNICTPTKVHHENAIAALEAKKHVLIEKPVARTLQEATEINDAAKKNQMKLMVGMNNRFRPDAMILKTLIQENDIGKIFYAKAGWFRKLQAQGVWLTRKEQSGGGVVLDLGIVMFDLAFWMMGYPEVKEVTATNYTHMTRDVEDSSIVYLKMKNGSTMTIESSWSFESNTDFFYCDCFGTEGSGSLNPFRILKRMHGSLVNVAPASQETPQNLYRKSYENEIKHWVSVLQNLHPVQSTGDEAIHRMKVVEAIYRSAKGGRSIVLT